MISGVFLFFGTMVAPALVRYVEKFGRTALYLSVPIITIKNSVNFCNTIANGIIKKKRKAFMGWKYKFVVLFVAVLPMLGGMRAAGTAEMAEQSDSGEQRVLQWVDFAIPAAAMERALAIDIKSRGEEEPVDWITLLALLGTRYGGNWNSYSAADMDRDAEQLRAGKAPQDILQGYQNYSYFETAYHAVLDGFVGEYQKERPSEERPGLVVLEDGYGLRAYHPIAEGYGYSHYRDFGSSRSYGFRRRHLGNDLCGFIGTPVVAVESGYVEEIGWNQYGGWRVGIRSFDNKRYYYYAHLRKDRPFAADLEAGSKVQAGEVIGYLGMTGYSSTENVNNMKVPHLHFGMQLIFDESQKDADAEIWIDVYDLVELLESNRATVVRDEESKEYTRKYNLFDEHFAGAE